MQATALLVGAGEMQGREQGYGVRDEGSRDGMAGKDGADVFLWHAEDRGCVVLSVTAPLIYLQFTRLSVT